MAEYINRNELVENLDRFAPEHLTPLIKTLIEKQPTAEVVEIGSCDGCNNIAFRYPYASMFPCCSCVRANRKDYYERGKNDD